MSRNVAFALTLGITLGIYGAPVLAGHHEPPQAEKPAPDAGGSEHEAKHPGEHEGHQGHDGHEGHPGHAGHDDHTSHEGHDGHANHEGHGGSDAKR